MSGTRYGSLPDFHLFLELFLVSISNVLIGSPWSSLFWLFKRFRKIVERKILLHRTVDFVTCAGRIRSNELRFADPWLILCRPEKSVTAFEGAAFAVDDEGTRKTADEGQAGGTSSADSEQIREQDHINPNIHEEDHVRPFYEQLGYLVGSPSMHLVPPAVQKSVQQDSGDRVLVQDEPVDAGAARAADHSRLPVTYSTVERQKLSHVRWEEMRSVALPSFVTRNAPEMFGDIDAGSVFPTAFYAFDLWSWMEKLAGLLNWIHSSAFAEEAREVFQLGGGAEGSAASMAGEEIIAEEREATTSAPSETTRQQPWGEFRAVTHVNPERDLKESKQFSTKLRVFLTLRESTRQEQLANKDKDPAGRFLSSLASRILGNVALQMNINMDEEAENYKSHVFETDEDTPNPRGGNNDLLSPILVDDEVDIRNALTDGNQKWSLGEIVLGVWNQETFVRTEGDASLSWLLYLRFLILFLTQANYSEKECRREVAVFAHATWLFFWVYTREAEKHIAADSQHEHQAVTGSSSRTIRGTIFRLAKIWQEPAVRYLRQLAGHLKKTRCQPQFVAPLRGDFVDANLRVQDQHQTRKSFGNHIAIDYYRESFKGSVAPRVSRKSCARVAHQSASKRIESSSRHQAEPRWTPFSPPTFETYNSKVETCSFGGLADVKFEDEHYLSIPIRPKMERLLLRQNNHVLDAGQGGTDHWDDASNLAWVWCDAQGEVLEKSARFAESESYFNFGAAPKADRLCGAATRNAANVVKAHTLSNENRDKVDADAHAPHAASATTYNDDWVNFLKKIQQVIRWDQHASWSYTWI
ncbi:unnamed protein product [Amoebophrya sp. A120]|nr:unnamed protein product [Amoebophrya sp. A120]|eukprot:GSA120T00005602001.1